MRDNKQPGIENAKNCQEFQHGRKGHTAQTVLVVDDEKVIALLLRRILEKAGFLVYYESDSIQALKFFQAKHAEIDVLMCDMSMPQMTGEVFIQKVLKLKPDMPTVLMSGNTFKLPVSLQNVSSVILLEKPLDEENVLHVLQHLLVAKD